ncbi:MAG: tyrosine-type recombinase/integrase [Acidiphilium sp.]|nr:tyrosine-type recombinase/integrase [Acidiphilium sp.]
MTPLRQVLADYLVVRRALGYRLVRAEKLLTQFLTFVEDRDEDHLTIETALAWATAPANADPNWMSRRLSVVRRFAIHLRGIDPATQVPPADILPGRSRRATPYLYSTEEIATLMSTTAILQGAHRRATYRTLIGLLTATGMRVGETIGLDRDDLDTITGVLTIRNGKFGRSRELPLHSSTLTALNDYLGSTERPYHARKVSAFFLSPAGTRLLYTNVQNTFQRLARHSGITPRSAACRPRLHDLRHSFAVNTILDAYREGVDPGARLAILSTYLGHINPAHTYWYLSASPELLQLAGDRLERYLGGGA